MWPRTAKWPTAPPPSAPSTQWLHPVGGGQRPLLSEAHHSPLHHTPTLDDFRHWRSEPRAVSFAGVAHPAGHEGEDDVFIASSRRRDALGEHGIGDDARALAGGQAHPPRHRAEVVPPRSHVSKPRRPAGGGVAPALALPGALRIALPCGVARCGAHPREKLDVSYLTARSLSTPVQFDQREAQRLSQRARSRSERTVKRPQRPGAASCDLGEATAEREHRRSHDRHARVLADAIARSRGAAGCRRPCTSKAGDSIRQVLALRERPA